MMHLVLFGLLASACASPYYYSLPRPFPRFGDYFHPPVFNGNFFDSRGFRDEVNHWVEDFSKHLQRLSSKERAINGDVYSVSIRLPGFEKDDIMVKAINGLVMIQAAHSNGAGGVSTFQTTEALPNYVDSTPQWSYKDGVLKIEFPLKKETRAETAAPPVTRDQEESEPQQGDTNQNADVGADLKQLGVVNEAGDTTEATN